MLSSYLKWHILIVLGNAHLSGPGWGRVVPGWEEAVLGKRWAILYFAFHTSSEAAPYDTPGKLAFYPEIQYFLVHNLIILKEVALQF